MEINTLNISRSVLFITLILAFSPGAATSAPRDVSPSRTAPLPPTPPHDMLAVQVTIDFDRSIASKIVQAVSRDEAAAIWNAYGVELLWSDPAPEAALHLNVIVAPDDTDLAPGRLHPELGRTTIDRSGAVCGSIRISSDAIALLLRQPHAGDPPLSDREFGRALGRVLAHEVGHVLLGSCHDRVGLMRSAFTADHLARLDRRSFQLTDATARRLQSRIVRRGESQASRGERLTTKNGPVG